eukprot:1040710-Prymnesium_polylepis.1
MHEPAAGGRENGALVDTGAYGSNRVSRAYMFHTNDTLVCAITLVRDRAAVVAPRSLVRGEAEGTVGACGWQLAL